MARSTVGEGVTVGGIGVDVNTGSDVAVGDRVGWGVPVATWVGACAASGSAEEEAAARGGVGVGVIRLQPAISITPKATIQTGKPMRKRDTSRLHSDRFSGTCARSSTTARGIIARPPSSCPTTHDAASQ